MNIHRDNNSILIYIFLLLLITSKVSYGQSLVAGAADESVPITTTTNGVYEDICSITLNSLSGVNAVMLLANFEMELAGGNADVTGAYQINDGVDVSAEITRYVIGKEYDDKGLGALNHIFSYSNFTGSKTFTLQHQRIEPGNKKNISSKGNMVAIVLDDSNVSLPHDIKSIADVTTSSTSYEAITGTQTNLISLPYKGGIYISISFSTEGSTSLVADWQIESSTDGTNFSGIPGGLISRSNSTDVGAATLTVLLEDQAAGDYYFRVSHKTSTGILTTRNLTLIAVGLSESNGNVYPTFSNTGGSGLTTSASAVAAFSTNNISSENSSNSLFAHAVFNMSGSAEILSPGFSLDISNSTFTPITLNRYLSGTGTGSGGIVGLATGLSAGSSHQVSLDHFSDGTATLTTSNINIVGFQLKSSPAWDGSTDNDWNTSANWTNNAVPASYNNVNITTGSPNISSSTNADVNNLTIIGGSLSIESDTSNSGSLIVKGTASGLVNYKRHLAIDRWYLVSAPIENQNINSLLTNAANQIPQNPSLQYGLTDYNELANAYGNYYTNSTPGNLVSGQGYLLRRTNSDGQVTFTGDIADTDIAVNITRDGIGWQLLGNPFTSSVGITNTATSMENFLTINASQFDPSYVAIYLWDEQAGYNGTQNNYKVISNSGYVDPLSRIELDMDYIQAGQGFLIKSKTGGGSMTFSRAMQIHQSVSYMKSLKKSLNSATSWDGFRLIASAGDDQKATIIAFNKEMSEGLDPSYDVGLYRSDNSFKIYSLMDGSDDEVEYGIQCLPYSGLKKFKVPIGIFSEEGGSFTFGVEGIIREVNYRVIFEDRLNNEFINLIPKLEEYTVDIPGNSALNDRFFLHISQPGSNNAENGFEKSKFRAHQRKDKIIIEGEPSSNTLVTLFDINGRKIETKRLSEQFTNVLDISKRQSGIYILVITDKDVLQQIKIPLLF